jgi:hypothetical protein
MTVASISSGARTQVHLRPRFRIIRAPGGPDAEATTRSSGRVSTARQFQNAAIPKFGQSGSFDHRARAKRLDEFER